MASFDPKTKVWSCPPNTPLFNLNGNLGQLILHSLRLCSNEVLQVNADTGVELTGREIRKRTIRAAENLRARGYRHGDIISICAKNSDNVAPILYAGFLLGTPVNTLDPGFQIADFMHMLGQTRPRAIFCDSDNISVIRAATAKIGLTSADFFTFDEEVEGADAVDKLFAELGNDFTFESEKIANPGECIAAITCSSGTTGFSKGVMLSHKALLSMNYGQFTEDDVFLFTGSLYWISIVGLTIMSAVYRAKRIITTKEYDPELYLQYIEKYRPSGLFLSPTRLSMMIRSPSIDNYDISSLKIIASAGSVLGEELRGNLAIRFPDTPIMTFYGMSESVNGITGGLLDGNRPRTVGQMTAGADAKIVDEDGNALDNGQQGEILCKQQIMFSGYFNSPEETKAAFDEDGWYHSGDVGYFDNDGYLYIVDRIKDIILYRNFWIAPAPLEDKIESLDGVRQCAVVGIPDEEAVDLPAAVVVRSDGSTVTAERVAEIIASNYADAKRLRGGVYFVDSLPMTPSGKVKRREVKKIATEMYKQRQSVAASA